MTDPAWLAAESPLATPYFLGAYAHDPHGPDGRSLGHTLQRLIYEAADSLWEGGPPPTRDALLAAVDEARLAQGNSGDEYSYLLLELRYLRRYFGPEDYPQESADIPVFLAVSQTRFFVHLQEAIDRLGNALLMRVRPIFRLELPQVPETFVGRERERRELAAALVARSSVSLTGPPGAGKTTLGSVLSREWPGGRVFWYTFLPGLNDTLEALLFALAHFTRDYGHGALWAYLAANNGAVPDTAQATGLLRADLSAIGNPIPLVVLDEVDLLRTAGGEPRSSAHSQLLFFLEALLDMVPVLLIGQRTYVDTPVHLALPSLDAAGVAALLDAAGTHLPPSQAERVFKATGGLPRLVWLVVALLRSGADVDELTQLPLRGDAAPLFHRLWRRLDQEEKELLVGLTAFRRPAPGDVWARFEAACDSLYERRLLVVGNSGEIALQPFFRQLIYRELQPEQREQFHLNAGHIRAERGEYTAAAYQFAQANEPALALAVWFPHRDLEIRRGQAGEALEIFSAMSGKGLPEKAVRQLKVVQNQLYLLAGEAQRITDNIRSIKWDMDDVLTAEVYEQAARAVNATGDHEQSIAYYGQSIDVLARTVREITDRHVHRAILLHRIGDLQAAQREALSVEQRLAYLRGEIAYHENDYDRTVREMTEALRLAELLNEGHLAAEARRTIASVYSMMGNVDQAELMLRESIAFYESIGDRLRVAIQQTGLGGVFINARLFERAIPPSREALDFFETMGRTLYMAQPTTQLAEAYLETGQPEKAIEYAYRVINLEDQQYRPYAFYTLGLAQQRLGREDIAMQAFAEGLASARRSNDRFIEAYLLRNVGRLKASQGDISAAREALSAALALFAQMNLGQEVAESEQDLSGLGV